MSIAPWPREIASHPAFLVGSTQVSLGDDLAALVPEIPLPTYVFDVDSLRVVAVNSAAARIYGYSRGEFLSLTADFFRPEEDRAAFREFIALRGREKGRYRVRHLTRDGRLLPVEVVAEPVAVGARAALRVIVIDVSATADIEDERARLGQAVEQAAEAIVITDPIGTIVYVNPAFERVTGYAAAEVLGLNPRVLKSGRQDAVFYAEMWATLGRGEVWRGRLVNRRKDGTEFEEEATISPVRDDEGMLRCYVAVKRDVSRERQLEEQVRQSTKMEAIGRLAGGVAHDFNNLLGVITGYAELGLRRLSPECDVRRHLSEILRAADRAAGLTRQLLAFSRRQVLQPRIVDVNAVVRDMSRLIDRLIGEDVVLRTALGPEALRVMADPGQLEQVLMNLAVNARDAMPDGGELVVETAAVIAPGTDGRSRAHVSLVVSDTGCGMDGPTLTRIFEPFFTTKGEGKGTGLGLSTVWGIVTRSGGSIGVESRLGVGTTFRILLPHVAQEAEAPPAGEAPPVAKAPAASADGPARSTVLVVDDEAPLRSIVRDVLEGAGYAVVEAADGTEALAAAAAAPALDLVVTDLTMPGVDASALVSQLRAARPGLRVLVMSGRAEPAGAADRFLSKPFTTVELERAVRDALAAA